MSDNLKMGPVNLQFFSEPAQPAEPAQEPQVSQEPQGEPQESLLDFLQKQMEQDSTEPQQEPQQELPQPQQAPELPEKLRGKSAEEIARSYLELEKKLGEQGNQIHQTQQQYQQAQQQLQQMQSYIQHMMGMQKTQQSPEDIQKQNEEWLNKFYENPLSTLSSVIQQNVQRAVEPISQWLQYKEQVDNYNKQVQQVSQKYSDFSNLLPEMEQIVKEQGAYLANLPNAVETIYEKAKARKIQALPNIEQLLQDPQNRQKILRDESIKNEILKNYAQGVKQNQPPIVIGSQPGELPSSPPVEMKDSKDTRKALTSYLQKIVGGGNR